MKPTASRAFAGRSAVAGPSGRPALHSLGDAMAVSPPREIFTIQWLRAIAATFVVVFHTSQGVEFRTGVMTSHWTDFGAVGVDVFFVVSGFIMTVTTAGKQFIAKDFLVKRLIRILPVYWILTILRPFRWSRCLRSFCSPSFPFPISLRHCWWSHTIRRGGGSCR